MQTSVGHSFLVQDVIRKHRILDMLTVGTCFRQLGFHLGFSIRILSYRGFRTRGPNLLRLLHCGSLCNVCRLLFLSDLWAKTPCGTSRTQQQFSQRGQKSWTLDPNRSRRDSFHNANRGGKVPGEVKEAGVKKAKER